MSRYKNKIIILIVFIIYTIFVYTVLYSILTKDIICPKNMELIDKIIQF